MTIRITNRYVVRTIARFFKSKMTTLTFKFESSYYDDEQIYAAFVRQYVTELREKTEEYITELSEEVGEKL